MSGVINKLHAMMKDCDTPFLLIGDFALTKYLPERRFFMQNNRAKKSVTGLKASVLKAFAKNLKAMPDLE